VKKNFVFNGASEMNGRKYNILVLGQSGVGKSTWINSMANYFSYENFDAALGQPPKCIVPTSFNIFDAIGNSHLISIGKPNENENTVNIAASTTQRPQVYHFKHPDCEVNIIDVPGIGDHRGVDMDNTNVKAILDTVSLFDELHAICILIKATDTILNTQFKYCLNELLMHLHKEAIPNVAFVFTNSIAAGFRPGSAFTVLREYLKELKDTKNIEIPLDRERVYCIDNEAFRFQCAYHQVPEFQNEDSSPYKNAWDKSQKAVRILFKRMRHVIPHNVVHTLSINQARAIILSLMQPLAIITSLIQANISNYQHNFDDIVDLLTKNLMISECDVELEELERPRTVCTATKCITVEVINGRHETFYRQICHDDCFLEEIALKKFPEEGLRNCAAMDDDSNCLYCQCSYDVHMHLDVDQRRVLRSSKINDEFARLQNAGQREAEDIVNNLLKNLEQEQEAITTAMLEFTAYLNQNALLEENDVFEKLMEVEIRNQQAAVDEGADSSILDKLNENLDDYLRRKKIIQETVGGMENAAIRNIDSTEVGIVQQKLFALPLYGEKIKEFYDKYTSSNQERVENKSFIECDMPYSPVRE